MYRGCLAFRAPLPPDPSSARFKQPRKPTTGGNGESAGRKSGKGVRSRKHPEPFNCILLSRSPRAKHIAMAATETGEAAEEPQVEDTAVPTNRFTRAPEGLSEKGSVSQVRVYEQLLTLRKRFSEKLSDANRNIRQLEKAAKTKDQKIKKMKQKFGFVAAETEAIARLAEDTQYLLNYGVQLEQASDKMNQLSERLRKLHTVMEENMDALDSQSTRTVPIYWEGVAEDVKLMGSFDDWTRGITLSAEDYTFAGSQLFSAEVDLIPGEYQVKFLVDGEWRCYADWPVCGEGFEANNLLSVQ